MHRAQAANHDHQQQVDGLQDVELVGRDELQLVGIQRACNACQPGRQGKRQGFVARKVNAHALRRYF